MSGTSRAWVHVEDGPSRVRFHDAAVASGQCRTADSQILACIGSPATGHVLSACLRDRPGGQQRHGRGGVLGVDIGAVDELRLRGPRIVRVGPGNRSSLPI